MLDDITLTRRGKIVFSGLLVLIVVPAIVYGFSKAQDREEAFSQLSVPESGGEVLDTSSNESADVLSKVGQMMVLPDGDEPQVAVISDVSKLSGRDVFKNAKNGDYVLVFTQARKVILFRPSENKIVDVLNVSVTDQTIPEQASPGPDIPSSPTPLVEETEESIDATGSSQIDTQ